MFSRGIEMKHWRGIGLQSHQEDFNNRHEEEINDISLENKAIWYLEHLQCYIETYQKTNILSQVLL